MKFTFANNSTKSMHDNNKLRLIEYILTIATEFSKPALIPKSVIFGSPLRFTSKLAGFMSL
jgi:hypothetical protein